MPGTDEAAAPHRGGSPGRGHPSRDRGPPRRERADRGGHRKPGTSPTDPRIVTATRTLHRPGGVETTAAALACDAGLSLSRFLHLFVEQTGAGVRCYRRWARMILAAEVLVRGGDLTRAAADAGFATPSHFSAAFRRMFGLTPSRLLGTGLRISTADR